MKQTLKLLCGLGLVTIAMSALAEAPVVSLSQPSTVERGNLLPPAPSKASGAPVHGIRMAQNSQQQSSTRSVPRDGGGDSMTNTLSQSLKRTAANVTDNNPLIGPTSPTLVTPSAQTEALPLPQRVARVEQQLQNLARFDAAGKISDLQQQVQQLSGELQVQQHDIQLLNQQLRNFYQDLSQQIKSVKNLGDNAPPSGNTLNTSTLNSPLNGASDQQVAETTTYRSAFTALTKKQYGQSLIGFKDFLSKYPNSKLAVNAHYWLGEIYAQQDKSKAALAEFNKVISKYPKSPKVRDAKLRAAMIMADQGQTATARRAFQAVKQQYPNTTAARLADLQLQQMN